MSEFINERTIDKICEISGPRTIQIDEDTYCTVPLHRIVPHTPSPDELTLSSLQGIVDLVKSEHSKVGNLPIFVQVVDFNKVEVYTTYQDEYKRNYLYCAKSDREAFYFGWKKYENAIISLRSEFVETKDTVYVLNLLSKITEENSVKSEDNGLTQSCEVRKGIQLKATEVIRPIVKLCPYRTFMEVEQPESEFLLRVRDGGEVGLFEADGGMWKLQAKNNIKSFFDNQLKELIEQGLVIVTI